MVDASASFQCLLVIELRWLIGEKMLLMRKWHLPLQSVTLTRPGLAESDINKQGSVGGGC